MLLQAAANGDKAGTALLPAHGAKPAPRYLARKQARDPAGAARHEEIISLLEAGDTGFW